MLEDFVSNIFFIKYYKWFFNIISNFENFIKSFDLFSKHFLDLLKKNTTTWKSYFQHLNYSKFYF